MPFDWREFLIFANGLRNDSSEAAQRTCLGRVYYYVYNYGLVNARKLNFSGRLPGLHRKLWAWCEKHSDPDVKQLGLLGLRMHSKRIEADYTDDTVLNLLSEVNTQFQRAERFEAIVAKINGIPPPPPLSQ